MTARNVWPGGRRHAMDQGEHEAWNARNCPGTRQLCSLCDEPTGRCEEDSLYAEDGAGPYCEKCRKDVEVVPGMESGEQMTASERADSICRWTNPALRDLVIEAILTHAQAVREEDAAIAASHICGCGGDGTEIARRMRERKVK